MNKVIKVKLPYAKPTVNALENPKTTNPNGVITFHAYNDIVKAAILEYIASGVKVEVSLTNEKPVDGEWLE